MIYLDTHSSTPLETEVFNSMEPYFIKKFGNPSSPHMIGEEAKEAVELAREQVAKVINAEPENIFFTSSATEANNIILKYKDEREYVVCTNSEHSSIMKSLCNSSLSFGIKIQSDGTLDYNKLDSILAGCGNKVKLVSIIAANNEIGTIHNLDIIGKICEQYNIRFHTDATQAIGYINIDVKKMNIFSLTLSGHKIYGPKGVGILYVKDPNIITPLIDGGYQNVITSGTQNVPAIVGIGKACELLNLNNIYNLKNLRDRLLLGLTNELPDIIVNGTMDNRLPHNLNISIPNVPSEVLIKGLDDIAISGGSACLSGNIEPSHVIKALGNPYPECAIRFGLGRQTTESDIDYVVSRISEVVKIIRGH